MGFADAVGTNARQGGLHMIDVRTPNSPLFAGCYDLAAAHGTSSIDHNLYVRGNRVFEGNCASGFRVLEFTDRASEDLTEVAYFDTHPENDAVAFSRAWSVYPFFSSGTIVVSDIERGLFVLTPPAAQIGTAASTADSRDAAGGL